MGVLNKVWYFLLFILIAGLFLYGEAYQRQNSENVFRLENYLENPEKYGDTEWQHFGRIINISHDHFYFDSGSFNIKVYGSGARKAVFGETELLLNHRKDGITELVDYHNYDYNYILYIVSFFALIVFIIIFLKEWKITPGGFKNA